VRCSRAHHTIPFTAARRCSGSRCGEAKKESESEISAHSVLRKKDGLPRPFSSALFCNFEKTDLCVPKKAKILHHGSTNISQFSSSRSRSTATKRKFETDVATTRATLPRAGSRQRAGFMVFPSLEPHESYHIEYKGEGVFLFSYFHASSPGKWKPHLQHHGNASGGWRWNFA
jgi:hypothetical protein